MYLENLATTLGSREQLAIAEFAESMLVIPKVLRLRDFKHTICQEFLLVSETAFIQVLAVNAAKDATDLVAKLRSNHHKSQTKADKKHLSRWARIP